MKNISISQARRYVKDGIGELHDVIKRELPIGMTFTKGKSMYKILQHGLPFDDNPRIQVLNLMTDKSKWIYIFPHIID
jgi:hypothetical protein